MGVGISVDHRRKNRCTESLQENVARLKLYRSKLMVLPRKSKAKKGDTTRAEAQNVPQNTVKEIIKIDKKPLKEKARAISKEELAFSAKNPCALRGPTSTSTGRRRSARRPRTRPRRSSSKRRAWELRASDGTAQESGFK